LREREAADDHEVGELHQQREDDEVGQTRGRLKVGRKMTAVSTNTRCLRAGEEPTDPDLERRRRFDVLQPLVERRDRSTA
jgi:hypothetical protein